MSEKRSSRDEVTIGTRVGDVSDTLKENSLRIVDEVAKIQPQIAQTMSNLQLDYIQAVKTMIQTAFANQKQVVSTFNVPQSAAVNEQVARQSTELSNNVVRSVGIFNQLTINALDAARENVKIYSRTVDAVTEFGGNILKAWTSYLAAQQQQFSRA